MLRRLPRGPMMEGTFLGRSTMSESTTKAPPIVLIHGLWMTARSWDRWVEYYRAKGHEVIVPTYPGFEIEVEALRERPEIIAEASVPETLDHLSEVIESLDRPPIIMGHSFGGTFTQLLVNRGLGAAAVVIDSAPPEGVRVNPPSQIKSLFPILKNPANRHRAVASPRSSSTTRSPTRSAGRSPTQP